MITSENVLRHNFSVFLFHEKKFIFFKSESFEHNRYSNGKYF